MIRQVMIYIGRLVFWLTWPLSWCYLRRGGLRSRVLVTTKSHVLLVQHWHGTGEWSLPGGGLKRGEEPASGAARELYEETNLALGVEKLQDLGQANLKVHGLQYPAQLFHAQLDNQLRVRPRMPEIIAAEWFNSDNLDQLTISADVAEARSRLRR